MATFIEKLQCTMGFHNYIPTVCVDSHLHHDGIERAYTRDVVYCPRCGYGQEYLRCYHTADFPYKIEPLRETREFRK